MACEHDPMAEDGGAAIDALIRALAAMTVVVGRAEARERHLAHGGGTASTSRFARAYHAEEGRHARGRHVDATRAKASRPGGSGPEAGAASRR